MGAELRVVDGEPHPYRMKDLCELTGLGRQAIHFYIQRGLLPPGQKTGRNMAYYREEHLTRLRLIRKLQHERFLPLRAIKAILDDQEGAFSRAQRPFVLGLKSHLSAELAPSSEATEAVAELLTRTGVPREDFDRMLALELFATRLDDGGEERMRADDVWLVEHWAELRRSGLAEEAGYEVDDILLYESAVASLFQQQLALFLRRTRGLAPPRAASMVERAVPLIEGLLTGLHRAKVRDFVASLEAEADGGSG